MATVTNNDLIDGISGKLGHSLVFKTMRGKTFISTRARLPDKKKETTAQRSTRVTFRQASHWAQLILLDAEKKVYYQQRARALKLPNAYTAALTDYMRTSQLKEVRKDKEATTYAVSKKGFDLKQVQVVMYDTTGSIKETRTVHEARGQSYVFRLSDNERQAKVIVSACDQTDRVRSWEITEVQWALATKSQIK